MLLSRGFIALFAVLLSFNSFAQNVDSLSQKLDILQKHADSTGGQVNDVSEKRYNENTKITAPVYGALIINDLKQQAISPFTVNRNQWVKNARFAVIAAGLTFIDKPVQKWAVKQIQNNSWIRPTSNTITNVGGIYEGVTFAGLAAYGWAFKNQKIKTTTYLASQAYLTTTLWETLFKLLSGRARPAYYNPNTLETDPTFHGPFYKLPVDSNGHRTNSAFPSGHTALAFAAATVYAMEYKNVKGIPLVAYSAASLIGLSRIMLNRHWTTDVFVGAGLGILCGQQVVNNYHRYSKLKSKKKPGQQQSLTFNLQYNGGQLMPGMVYKF